MNDRHDYARDVRNGLTDAKMLCERLGLLVRGQWKPQPKGAIVRCPWHKDSTPSCSVRTGRDGTIGVKCFACDAGGDALSLVAKMYNLSLKTDFRQVLICAAEAGGMAHLAAEIERGEPAAERPAMAPPPAPEPERDYPPSDEVLDVWNRAKPACDDEEASAWISTRWPLGAPSPDAVTGADVARVILPKARLPRWAAYQGLPWTETGHRLVFAMRDATGAIRSLRAGRITDGTTPKRLPPGGHRASGLVLACALAQGMLAGTWRPADVAILEGEPDFLVRASLRNGPPIANIGIVSGSWTEELAARFPTPIDGPPCRIHIRTDKDEAGARYGREVAASLRRRGCLVAWTAREAS